MIRPSNGVATMDLLSTQEREARFVRYIEMLASVIGHKDREGPLRDYSVGLLTARGSWSVEPLAADA
jgi:SRSO17 transposase